MIHRSLVHHLRVALTSGRDLPEKVFDRSAVHSGGGCQPQASESSRTILYSRSYHQRWVLGGGTGYRRHVPYRVLRVTCVSGGAGSRQLRRTGVQHSPDQCQSHRRRLPQATSSREQRTYLYTPSSQCPAQSPARGSGNICRGENQILGWGSRVRACAAPWPLGGLPPACLPREPLGV